MITFEPIEISFKWDSQNFKKAFESAYTYEYKNSARRYIGWLFIAMAQFGVVAALKGGVFGLLLLSTLLIFYWYVVKKWLLFKRALRAYENSSLKDKEIKLFASKSGIEQDENLIDWSSIRGVVPVGDDIMLYLEDRPYYIPALAFKSIEDKNSFKELAKSEGKLYD